MEKDRIKKNLQLYKSVDNIEKLIMHYINNIEEQDPEINVNTLMFDFNNIKSFVNTSMRTKDNN